MAIDRRDVIQILRDENELLKARNKQVSKKLARSQQAFRVLNTLCDQAQAIADTYSSAEELSNVLRLLLEIVLHASDIENGSLLLVDESSNELEFVAVVGESREYLMNHRVSIETGLVGETIRSGKPLLYGDVRSSRVWSKAIDESLNFHTQSLMCVPLKNRDTIIGAIEVVNHVDESPFDEHDLDILMVSTRLVGLALERVEAITLALESET